MGGVAITAGYYLMAKLGMHLLVEFPAAEFFDLEQVEVKDGIIAAKRLPRSRLFLWNDPRGNHDLILFVGEAQPPARGGAFCRKLLDQAKQLNVGSVFTFAAMATRMRPKQPSRVFGAAIDRATLARFKSLGTQALESGTISGLNGVLLGMAAGASLPGGCLLGEIPQVFAHIPFPKASVAVLETFAKMTGISIDMDELREHASTVEQTLEDFLNRMEDSVSPGEIESASHGSGDVERERRPESREHSRIHLLFEEARKDRARAYELKQELDRLGLFNEFEDRFLDLFKEP